MTVRQSRLVFLCLKTCYVLSPGVHLLKTSTFVRLHNGFGCLHNSNETFRWYGPEAWRTWDNVWPDDYRLKPARIHSAVELEQVIQDS